MGKFLNTAKYAIEVVAVLGSGIYGGYKFSEFLKDRHSGTENRNKISHKKSQQIKKANNVDVSLKKTEQIASSKDVLLEERPFSGYNSPDSIQYDNLKSMGAAVAAEFANAASTVNQFEGLLICDIPIGDLVKAKDSSSQVRGYVVKDGKIVKQAKFSGVNPLSSASPILVRQTLAFFANMYMQEQIMGKLEDIRRDVNRINAHIEASELAFLNSSFETLKKKGLLNNPHEPDLILVERLNLEIGVIRKKYRDDLLPREIENMKVGSSYFRTAKGDAEEMEKKVKEKFFTYLQIAVESEFLWFLSNMILMMLVQKIYPLEEERTSQITEQLCQCSWNEYQIFVAQAKAIAETFMKECSKVSEFSQQEIDEMAIRVSSFIEKTGGRCVYPLNEIQKNLTQNFIAIKDNGELQIVRIQSAV